MNAKRLGKWALVLGSLFGPLLIFGLVYWTWCWGYWGRGNLLLQALFQCSCPAASEEARYRPFKVIASACTEPLLRGFSPSGRYLIIIQNAPDYQMRRLDLETGQMLDIGLKSGAVAFVRDDMLVARLPQNQGYVLVDLNDRTQMQLQNYDTIDAVIEKLKGAQQVIVTDDKFANPYLIGLARDYKQHAQDNVIVSWDNKTEALLKILTDNAISYETLPPPYKIGMVESARYSLSAQFYAKLAGIYSTHNNQLIVPTGQVPGSSTNAAVMGWALNGHAVVYGDGGYRYLADNRQSAIFPSLFPVPQPILLLEVPPQYWATPTPAP